MNDPHRHDTSTGPTPGPGVDPERPADPDLSSRPFPAADFAPSLRFPVFQAGTVFGDYEILSELGRGGMGQVFKALHRRDNHVVALKFIRSDQIGKPAVVRRFVREVRANKRLNHRNIVGLHEAEQHEGTWFLAMEYVAGVDLAAMVKQRGSLPVEEACDYLYQTALGLQHMHEQGMVHRDIKPSNLLVEQAQSTGGVGDSEPGAAPAFGVVKILDMGLALIRQADSSLSGLGLPAVAPAAGHQASGGLTLTEFNALIGTPDYMAPEQVENPHAADIRADLYSLGCTLYYLLAARPPFPDGTTFQKLDKQRWAIPPRLDDLRPDAPPGLVDIARQLLAKRPEHRFSTPADLATALRGFIRTPARSTGSQVDVSSWLEIGQIDGGPPTELNDGGVAERPADDQLTVPEGRSQPDLRGHLDVITAVAFSKDGRLLASASRDGTARLWDLATGREAGRFTGHGQAEVYAVAVGPENLVASAGSDRVIRVWSGGGNQTIRWFSGHTGEICGVAWSPDGKYLLSGGADQMVRLWDVERCREVHRFGGLISGRHWDTVQSVAFSPDQFLVASGSRDQSVRVWDMSSRRELMILNGHQSTVYATVFSPAGGWILSGGDRTARLWDASTGAELRRFEGHTDSVTAVAFTPDGTRAVSGSKDHTFRVWDVETGRQLFCDGLFKHRVMAVAVAPTGRLLAAAGGDRVIRLLRLPPARGSVEAFPPQPS